MGRCIQNRCNDVSSTHQCASREFINLEIVNTWTNNWTCIKELNKPQIYIKTLCGCNKRSHLSQEGSDETNLSSTRNIRSCFDGQLILLEKELCQRVVEVSLCNTQVQSPSRLADLLITKFQKYLKIARKRKETPWGKRIRLQKNWTQRCFWWAKNPFFLQNHFQNLLLFVDCAINTGVFPIWLRCSFTDLQTQ